MDADGDGEVIWWYMWVGGGKLWSGEGRAVESNAVDPFMRMSYVCSCYPVADA